MIRFILKEDTELTPELIKIKADLDKALEAELNEIDARQDFTWVKKQIASDDARQRYEDAWFECLTDAGYVVRPVFESKSKSLAEEFKQYENLWN